MPSEVLGYSGFSSAAETSPVPANVAGATPSVGEPFSVEGLTFYRYAEGVTPSVNGVPLVRTDVVDETAPAAPVISNAYLHSRGRNSRDGGSCGRLHTFHFEVEATDDVAEPNRLSYAVYMAETEDAFANEADVVITYEEGDLWAWGTEADEGATRYVRLRAIDQAGNVGPLSESVRIDTGSAPGCSASGNAPLSQLALILAALGLVAARRRRRS